MRRLAVLLVTLASLVAGCSLAADVTLAPSAAGISTRIEPADPIIRNEEPSEEDCAYEIGEEDTCYDLYGFWGIPEYEHGRCVHWQEIMRLENQNVHCVEGVVLNVECHDQVPDCLLRFTNGYGDYSLIASARTDTERAAWLSLVGNCVLANGVSFAEEGNPWMRVHDVDDVVPCY